MKAKSIYEAYARIRTIDQTIPDDVLDFMKDAAIEALKPNNVKKELTEVWLTALAQQQVIKQQIVEHKHKSHASNNVADALNIGNNIVVGIMDELKEIIDKL